MGPKAKGISLEEIWKTDLKKLKTDPEKAKGLSLYATELYAKFLAWYNNWIPQAGVRHLDINGGNIFYEQETQTYSFIDCMGLMGIEVVPPNVRIVQLSPIRFTREVIFIPPTHVDGISLMDLDVEAGVDELMAGFDLG